jgi:heme/copper-type cytochrome/quinol oxidase subunit 3
MTAESGSAARAAPRRAQPNGWWGMALFVAAEATIFGTMLATYFYLDFRSKRWPPTGIKDPSVVLPFVATGVLVATTIPMWLAARSVRSGRRKPAVWFIALALVIQGCYLAGQVLLFRHDLNTFSPRQTAYGSIYFTVLGAHHAHVVLGMLLDLAVLWQLIRSGLTNYWLVGVRALALYWYVVNALAVFVVFTQVSPTL